MIAWNFWMNTYAVNTTVVLVLIWMLVVKCLRASQGLSTQFLDKLETLMPGSLAVDAQSCVTFCNWVTLSFLQTMTGSSVTLSDLGTSTSMQDLLNAKVNKVQPVPCMLFVFVVLVADDRRLGGLYIPCYTRFTVDLACMWNVAVN